MGILNDQPSFPSQSQLDRRSLLRGHPDGFHGQEFYREQRLMDGEGTVHSRRPSVADPLDLPAAVVTVHPSSAPALKTAEGSCTRTSYEQFCLSGGVNVKYQPKPRQKQETVTRSQDPLIALPRPTGRQEKTLKDDSRYVTRSVPVHSARHKQNEDRGSNSAPMPNGHHRNNHDRKPRTRLPKLPKINNLLKEPMQQQVHGTSTAAEAGRKEKGGKRWASSWAGARATNPPTTSRDEARVPTSDNSSQPASNIASPIKTPSARQSNQHVQDIQKTSPSTNSSTPGTGNSSPVKPSKEPDQKSPWQQDKGSRKTETQEQKNKSNLELNVKNKPVKETKLTEEMRTMSVTQIDTKVTKRVSIRSKSSAVLTSRSDVTRQNSDSSESPLNKAPSIRVKSDSRDSQSTSTTQHSRVKPRKPAKKRTRRPVIITRKSVIKQKSLQSVYGGKTFKYQRQIRVLKKMEQVQRKEIDEFNQELKDKQNHRMASVVKQRMALKRARDRFDEEQVRRFRNQYVSWRSVEEKRLNSSSEVYGLPDFIYEDRYEKTLKKIPESQESTSSKKTPKKFQKYATWVRNLKVFESLLNPKVGGNVEGLFQPKKGKTIVEGIDTVKLDDNGGSARKKNVNVKRLIGSAKKLLTVTENMDDISEVSSYVSSDDDGSSIDLSDDDS